MQYNVVQCSIMQYDVIRFTVYHTRTCTMFVPLYYVCVYIYICIQNKSGELSLWCGSSWETPWHGQGDNFGILFTPAGDAARGLLVSVGALGTGSSTKMDPMLDRLFQVTGNLVERWKKDTIDMQDGCKIWRNLLDLSFFMAKFINGRPCRQAWAELVWLQSLGRNGRMLWAIWEQGDSSG